MKTAEKSKHTATPWQVEDADALAGHPFIPITNGKAGSEAYRLICEVQPNTENGMKLVLGDEDKANAAYIVRAVNSHEALVSALKDLHALCDKFMWVDESKGGKEVVPKEMKAAKAAITLAEAE